MSNEIGTKKLDRPMENPFLPEEPHEIVSDEQEVALIATDDRPDNYAEAEEEALPEWFDPTNFALTAGLGFSLYSIKMRRTLDPAFATGREIYLYDSGDIDNAEADQFSARLAVAYNPFVFDKFSLGIFAGYQAIPAIRGHDVQAGLGVTIDTDTASVGLNAYYTHIWVKDIGLTSVSNLKEVEQSLPAEVFLDMLPEELSMHGFGGSLSLNFNLTEYFQLGPYVNANYYLSPDSKMICITPGAQGTVKF
jgi:hypothetical protein